jgi:hypothetical protein
VPHLRFTRDRRGYEHIVLIQESSRRGRDRDRVLYVFRTPPGVRIGRDAFDPATLDLIERANPDIVFDWDAILESKPALPEEEPIRRPRAWRNGELPGQRGGREERRAPAAPVPALDRILGRDAAMRLRQRFAAVRQRLDEGPVDDERKVACEAKLSGLDPDSWVGDDLIRDRAAGFDASIEEIRRLLGLPKRRTRRGPRRDDEGAGALAPQNPSNAADGLLPRGEAPDAADPAEDPESNR